MPFTNYVTDQYYNLEWETREHRANQTSKIDYRCDFQNGECRVKREIKNPDWRTQSPMCCCKNCYSSKGYLMRLPKEAVEEVNVLFKEDIGFWKEGVGCTLPRKWRSDVCLSFNCLPNSGMCRAIENYLRTGRGIRKLIK